MSKIETDFEKLNHYEDIETYYPPLDDIKDFLYELFEDRVESQKYIVRINKKLEQLQSNWNSLREFVENDFTYDEYGMKMFDRSVLLDKMNELEGGENGD